MSHPRMFDEHDPLLARIRAIALALPGAQEKVSHGRPNFFTRKIFVYFGGSQRIDGDWVSHDDAMLVLPDPADRAGLLQDPRTFVPAYLGPYGWLGVQLPDPHGSAGWDEVAELVEDSYRITAGRRLVAELDQRAATD